MRLNNKFSISMFAAFSAALMLLVANVNATPKAKINATLDMNSETKAACSPCENGVMKCGEYFYVCGDREDYIR